MINWVIILLTAFSSLLCMASLFLVRIHSTPGVDGAQPLRLAATGFLFSALPHCVLFSTRGPQDLHCLHSNSLLLLPSPYWIGEYRTLPGWLDVQRPPCRGRDDPSYPSFGLRCLPLLSRLCLCYVEQLCEPQWDDMQRLFLHRWMWKVYVEHFSVLAY